MTRKHYIVRWEISTLASNAEEAATEVFDEFFRLSSDATVFEVEPIDGSARPLSIDVADLEEA